jgi:hypothetical protein
MGRIFEVRKASMFARWDRMAKQFTRIGKEIVIAVKAGGQIPAPMLRCVVVFKMHEVWVCQRTVWKLLSKEHREKN